MSKFSRHGFLMGCSAAIAHMTGARLSYTAFGSPEEEPNQQILITVFLRGGCDALSLLPPISGLDFEHYRNARPDLYLPESGVSAALPLNERFGLHPAAAPLYDLYNAQKLAIVHAAGLPSDTRSHFDAMSYMELGTPDPKSSTTGWLARHLTSSMGIKDDAPIPALAVSSLQPQSLQGYYKQSHSTMPQVGRRTSDTMRLFQDGSVGVYVPTVDTYPTNSFGRQLQLVAQMIRLQVGLKAATIDLGGWDTHNGQAGEDPSTGYFASLAETLAGGLAAFYEDLYATDTRYADRITVVVMSEFGRRLRENNERGTDHGHGGMMLVLGGQVNGGQVYGPWPGLHTDQLYDNADLEIATDYRQVLSEILVRQMGNPKLGFVFPGYEAYTPLGIVQGDDLPIDDSPGVHQIDLPLVTR